MTQMRGNVSDYLAIGLAGVAVWLYFRLRMYSLRPWFLATYITLMFSVMATVGMLTLYFVLGGDFW